MQLDGELVCHGDVRVKECKHKAVSAEQGRVPDLVSSKTEGTKLGLEVPDHHAAIQAARD